MKQALTRRSVLQGGALLAAAWAAPAVVPALAQSTASPAQAVPVRLGVASYTFRNFTRAQMIPLLLQAGVSNLNVKDVKDHLPADPEQEAKALADYVASGIRLHAAGAIYFAKNDDAEMRAKFEYCKRAGIGVMVAGDPTPEMLPRLERLVREYDMRIAIHNHGPEDKLWPSPLDVLKSLRGVDARIGCCIDLGHAARAGADVVKCIHEVGPRLFNLHMKDLTSFSSKESQVAVGDGIMPVEEIFAALIAIGYPGFVDLEYEVHGDDPLPGVIASMAYQRGVLAGMGYGGGRA